MRILGIDYGRRKIGLALASTKLAEPLLVFQFEREEELLRKIENIAQTEKVEKVVIGISEGKIAADSIRFGKRLRRKLKVPVIFHDESLSTQEAQKLAIEAGIKRRKRKRLEDAYSATLILQGYLNTHV